MSKLKFAWWPYVRNVILWHRFRGEDPSLKGSAREDEEALREAVRVTLEDMDGRERVELMRRAYWSNHRVTLERAAEDLFVSFATARRWQHDFFLEVAKARGLHSEEDE